MSARLLTPDEVKVLTGCVLLRTLEAPARDEVARRARAISLKKGQALFSLGEPAEAVFVVLRGQLKVLEPSDTGADVVLRLEGPGAPLALIAALTPGAKLPVTARAIEPATVARWTGADWADLMERHPRLALAALPLVLGRLREVQDQVRELATERVERRIARVVMRLVRHSGRRIADGVLIDTPLTRQELAEMTGTTLFTVSRVLSQWSHEGVLLSRGRRLVVRAPHRIAALAEDFVAGP